LAEGKQEPWLESVVKQWKMRGKGRESEYLFPLDVHWYKGTRM